MLVERSLVGGGVPCQLPGLATSSEEVFAWRLEAFIALGTRLRMPLGRFRTLHDAKVAAIVALRLRIRRRVHQSRPCQTDCNPPRFASTAFGNAWINPMMWNAFMGWKGVDQYDEADKVGQAFLDRYQETYGPVICGPTARCRGGVTSHLVDRFGEE